MIINAAFTCKKLTCTRYLVLIFFGLQIISGMFWFFVKPISVQAANAYTPSVDNEDDFTIVVLPDTQNYSSFYPSIFAAQTQWIADNAINLNIKMVLHMGDVVNDGDSVTEWSDAMNALNTLNNNNLPNLISIGNHDYDDQAATRGSVFFNSNINYNAWYANKSWFNGGAYEVGKSDNVYTTLQVGSSKYLFMTLEFGPRQAVIDWANQVIPNYSDYKVIIATHSYMYSDNTRQGIGDSWNPHNYGIGNDTNDGDDMWNELAKLHENILFITNGHVLNDGIGQRTELGDNGNAVNQILTNYQLLPNGGNGWLRYYEFKPSENKIYAYTYSPYLGQFDTSYSSQFLLNINNDENPPITVISSIPASPDGNNGWYKTIPTIGFSNNEAGTVSYSWNTTDSFNTYTSTITAPQGQNILYYYSTDLIGNKEGIKTEAFNVDVTKPNITSHNAPTYSTNISPTTGFTVRWSGTDPYSNEVSSGIDGYQIQYRPHTTTAATLKVDGSNWTTQTKTQFSLGKPGYTYYFRVKVKDKTGNVSSWSPTKYTIVPFDNLLLRYSANWNGATSSKSYKNTLQYSSEKGQSATLVFKGKSVTLIAPKGPYKGKVDVYIRDKVNGVWKSFSKVKTLDLYSSINKYRVPFVVKSWTSSSTHQIKFFTTGTKNSSSKGTRVDIDGIAILK